MTISLAFLAPDLVKAAIDDAWLTKHRRQASPPAITRHISPDPYNADAALLLLGVAAPNSGTATLSQLRLLASGRLATGLSRANPSQRGWGQDRRLSIFRSSLAGGHRHFG